MRFGSLFAGIGGIDLGLERAGMECAWQVEIDDYCNRVLEKHWPDVRRYGNIREVGRRELATVDLIAGGFPCQPHSVAGKRGGAEDDRNLWPEFIRVIKELKPRYVLAENVPGIITTYIDTVLSDLEGEGYTCPPLNIPAVALDAPHRRERIFIVAYAGSPELRNQSGRRSGESGADPSGLGDNGAKELVADTERRRTGSGTGGRDRSLGDASSKSGEQRRSSEDGSRGWWTVEPDVGRVAYGVPSRVDRLRGLGNAVVPQVAEWIGERIIAFDKRT